MVIEITQPVAPKTSNDNEAAVAHVRDARDERRESADHGHELGVDDGFAAVLLVERVGALQVLLLEEARIGPVEDGGTGAAAEQIAAPIAGQAGDDQQHDHDGEVQLPGARHHADGEEQRIAGEHEADQQARSRRKRWRSAWRSPASRTARWTADGSAARAW